MSEVAAAPENRIDSDERGVDDVVINNVKTFRMERMDKDAFWIRCYGEDGHDHVFWIRSSKLITVRHDDEGAKAPTHAKARRGE